MDCVVDDSFVCWSCMVTGLHLGTTAQRITTAARRLRWAVMMFVCPSNRQMSWVNWPAIFNDMAAALEQSEQARRRWVADISHELRTPLAVLRGELEALQDGIRPLTAEAIDSLFGDVDAT